MTEMEALNTFVQTSRYARFLLDEPLSRIASSATNKDGADFKNVVEEVEDLIVSAKCLLRKLEAPNGGGGGGDESVTKSKRPASKTAHAVPNNAQVVAKYGPSTIRSNSPRPGLTRSLSLMSLSNRSVKSGGVASRFKRDTSSARGSMRKSFQPGAKSSKPSSLNGDACGEIYLFQGEKVDINSSFVNLCKKLNSKELNCGYYCRPCFAMCPNEKEWVEHCASKAHSTIFLKNIKNIMSSCNKCSVKVIGSRLLATSYIRYHIQENHPEIREGDFFHHYELENIEPPKQQRGHEGNQQPQARQSRKDNFVKNPDNKFRKFPTPKTNDEPKSDADVLDPIFLNVMKKKKDVIDPEFQPFHGICLVCREVKEDVFEYIQHQMEHGDRLQTEDCDTCNLSLCGFDDNLRRFLSHPAHDEVDKYAR